MIEKLRHRIKAKETFEPSVIAALPKKYGGKRNESPSPIRVNVMDLFGMNKKAAPAP